jgi:hypothetical protein
MQDSNRTNRPRKVLYADQFSYTRGDQYKGTLRMGQRIESRLYGGRPGVILAIHGSQTPGSIERIGGGAVSMGGSAEIDVVFEDHISRRIPECIIRGVQWRISTEAATMGELAIWVEDAEGEQQRAKDEEKRERDEHNAEMDALPAQYPNLTPVDGKRLDHVIGAANMRRQLKGAFPGVKFSVRSQSYSGGCSIHVEWEDGPTSQQVSEITSRYEKCSFDGMQDLKERKKNPFSDVFGGADFVFTRRNLSPRALVVAGAAAGWEYGESHVEHGQVNGLTPQEMTIVRHVASEIDFQETALEVLS